MSSAVCRARGVSAVLLASSAFRVVSQALLVLLSSLGLLFLGAVCTDLYRYFLDVLMRNTVSCSLEQNGELIKILRSGN